jgi:hypothetical protein
LTVAFPQIISSKLDFPRSSFLPASIEPFEFQFIRDEEATAQMEMRRDIFAIEVLANCLHNKVAADHRGAWAVTWRRSAGQREVTCRGDRGKEQDGGQKRENRSWHDEV